MKYSCLLAFLFLFCANAAYTQDLPETDLYLFNFTRTGDNFRFKNPTYLSNFNPSGYNNQPSFKDNSSLYITTDVYGNKNDIIELNLIKKSLLRVTATDEDEYSPAVSPHHGHFSCVRVEKDGTTQLLWTYPEDRSNFGGNVLRTIGNVGYYIWLSQEEVALFLVDDTHKLAIANIETDKNEIIIDDIGRCLKVDRNGNVIFVHKVREDFWFLKSFDPRSRRTEIITQLFDQKEDFELLSDDSIIMASGSKLYYINPSTSDSWSEIGDFSKYSISNISRLVIKGNKLVFVNLK